MMNPFTRSALIQMALLSSMAFWLNFGCGSNDRAEDNENENERVAEREGAPRSSGGGSASRDREPARQPEAPRTAQITVPSGTTFTISLDQALSSKTSSPGAPVRAHLVSSIKSEGVTVAPDGAQVQGVVAEVEGSGRISGRAVIGLNFTTLETVSGMERMQTAMVDGTLRAPGTKKRDVVTIVGGTAAGAVIGKILGDTKLGAIIGAAAGTGVVLATKGEELELEPGYQLDLRLVEPLTVSVPERMLSD
jgi:hypothetical protein